MGDNECGKECVGESVRGSECFRESVCGRSSECVGESECVEVRVYGRE